MLTILILAIVLLLVVGVLVMPDRWIMVLMARIRGIPKHMIPEFIGDADACVVSFDDERITQLRRSNGEKESVRWDELAEMHVSLNNMELIGGGAFLVLVTQGGKTCSMRLKTDGVRELTERAASLPWFSTHQLLDALNAATDAQGKDGSKFLLWSQRRNGVAIPARLLGEPEPATLVCDDEFIRFESGSRQAAIRWAELTEVQMVLGPLGHDCRVLGTRGEFSFPMTAKGVDVFFERTDALPTLESLGEEWARSLEAIHGCNLVTTVFTLVRAVPGRIGALETAEEV